MKSTFFVAALCAAGLAFAQAEPGVDETQEESVEITDEDLTLGEDAFEAEVEEVEKVTDETVGQLLDAFVHDEKGWEFGKAQTKGSGDKNDKFIVVKGIGTITAKPKTSAYVNSRLLAYEEAMLKAKAQMAQLIGTALGAAVRLNMGETPEDIKATEETEFLISAFQSFPANSEGSRVFKVYCDRVNDLLAKQGIDPDKLAEEDPEELEKARAKLPALATTREAVAARTAAAFSFVQGLQAFYTVEAIDGDRGEIGVVALWSPKMNMLADFVINDETEITLTSKGKKQISQQIPQEGDEALLSTFGVRSMIDENGQYCLVSFGQASARTSSTQSANNAYEKAYLAAQAQIRSFVGETVAYNAENQIAEAQMEFVDAETGDESTLRVDFSKFQTFRESKADVLTIRGISQLKTWRMLHPETEKYVYGSIAVWTPDNKALAQELDAVNKEAHIKVQRAVDQTKRDMDNWGKRPDTSRATSGSKKAGGKKGGAAGGRGSSHTPGRFINRGAAGDEDAF